jgi:hypothetical protein
MEDGRGRFEAARPAGSALLSSDGLPLESKEGNRAGESDVGVATLATGGARGVTAALRAEAINEAAAALSSSGSEMKVAAS